MIRRFIQIWLKYGKYAHWSNGILMRFTIWSQKHPGPRWTVPPVLCVLTFLILTEAFVGHSLSIYRSSSTKILKNSELKRVGPSVAKSATGLGHGK